MTRAAHVGLAIHLLDIKGSLSRLQHHHRPVIYATDSKESTESAYPNKLKTCLLRRLALLVFTLLRTSKIILTCHSNVQNCFLPLLSSCGCADLSIHGQLKEVGEAFHAPGADRRTGIGYTSPYRCSYHLRPSLAEGSKAPTVRAYVSGPGGTGQPWSGAYYRE